MSTTKKSTHRAIAIQRAYEDPTPQDGYRVLVDHFWPRGRSKGVLKLDEWARDLAPSVELIHWFGHDPARWDELSIEFQLRRAPLPPAEGLGFVRSSHFHHSSTPLLCAEPSSDASRHLLSHGDFLRSPEGEGQAG
jgi:uncharacterized protein YeaO (DUF488 family)